MFPGGFFPKNYFAGTFWAPASEDNGDGFGDSGLFPYSILRRRSRR